MMAFSRVRKLLLHVESAAELSTWSRSFDAEFILCRVINPI